MINSIKQTLKHFSPVLGISALLMASACTDSSDSKTGQVPIDTTSVAKTDTATVQATTVKPKKKGKASTMMASDASTPTASRPQIEKDKNGVYSRAETMPEFPGHGPALSKYVEDHISYPQDAIDDAREGTVKVSFIVDEKGKVIDPAISGASVSRSLDNEAVRIVKEMPDWKPGTVKGKKVKTRLELPITFKLGDS